MLPLHSNHRRISGLVFLLGLTALLSVTVLGPNPAGAQGAGFLGAAESYAVLGGSTVTNTGPSVINGDLGVSPGSSITGFPPGVVTGTIHSADASALQAQDAVTTAYNDLAGRPATADLTGQDLGGLTLTPGVYSFSSSAQLTGTLTLDAQGNSAAVFIFKIGSELTTASSSSVLVTNGGTGCNVWWQVGSSATLGTATSFAGNILALTSITLTTGANVSGRALARNGAVTLDSNNVTPATCAAALPSLSLTKDDGGSTGAAPGDTITYTLNYANTGNTNLTNVTLSDTVPANTTFNSGTSGWSCAAGAGPGTVCTLVVGSLAVGASGSAVFTVAVDNPTLAADVSNTASITSTETGTPVSAGDTTPVIQPPPPSPGLSLTKSDGGATVAPGATISYTLSFQNTGNVALSGVTLTDTIPADTTFNAGASTAGWNCGVSPCTFDLGTLAPGTSGSAVFAVTVNSGTGATQITNSATITSGATSASASDTTPVTTPSPGPGATAVPPVMTAVPLQIFTATPTTSAAQGSGGGSGSNAQGVVSGLPNTGGGPPQPTYWMREPRQ